MVCINTTYLDVVNMTLLLQKEQPDLLRSTVQHEGVTPPLLDSHRRQVFDLSLTLTTVKCRIFINLRRLLVYSNPPLKRGQSRVSLDFGTGCGTTVQIVTSSLGAIGFGR